MTGEELLTEYTLRKQTTADIQAEAGLWLQFMNLVDNALYKLLIGIDPERYIDESTEYTVSTSPESETLPAAFKSIKYKGCGFYLKDASGNVTDKLSRTGYGSSLKGYYLRNTTVVFTGFTSSQTIVLRHVPKRTQYTDETDTMLLDEEYQGEYFQAFDLLYAEWENNPNDLFSAADRLKQAIDTIFMDFKRDTNVFNIPRISSAY